ncbi:hypothetical protein M758_4G225800 [Ceratodon purpureus]|nr:hypothetical protein M758_4G225800 [Ceratodon purpureus]
MTDSNSLHRTADKFITHCSRLQPTEAAPTVLGTTAKTPARLGSPIICRSCAARLPNVQRIRRQKQVSYCTSQRGSELRFTLSRRSGPWTIPMCWKSTELQLCKVLPAIKCSSNNDKQCVNIELLEYVHP